MRMVDAARQTHKPESDSGGSSGGEVTVEKSAEPRLAYVAKKRRPDAKKALLRRQAALTATPALLFTHLIMGKRMQDDILHGPLQRIPSFFERAPDPAGELSLRCLIAQIHDVAALSDKRFVFSASRVATVVSLAFAFSLFRIQQTERALRVRRRRRQVSQDPNFVWRYRLQGPADFSRLQARVSHPNFSVSLESL